MKSTLRWRQTCISIQNWVIGNNEIELLARLQRNSSYLSAKCFAAIIFISFGESACTRGAKFNISDIKGNGASSSGLRIRSWDMYELQMLPCEVINGELDVPCRHFSRLGNSQFLGESIDESSLISLSLCAIELFTQLKCWKNCKTTNHPSLTES